MGHFDPPVEKVKYKAMCLGFNKSTWKTRPVKGEVVDVYEEIDGGYLAIVNHGILHKMYFKRINFSNYKKIL